MTKTEMTKLKAQVRLNKMNARDPGFTGTKRKCLREIRNAEKKEKNNG